MKKQVRIRGLVRLFNHVRQQLQAGLAGHELEALKRRVDDAVRQTDSICRDSGTRPALLPAPSRNAYRFLVELDFAQIPAATADCPRAGRVRVSNVVAGLRACHRHIWRLAGTPADSKGTSALRAHLQHRVDAIEAICRSHGATSASLPRPSRSAFALMRFLTQGSNLEAHIDTVRRTAHLAAARMDPSEPAIVVDMTNSAQIWRRSRSKRETHLRISETFIRADDSVLTALVEAALFRKRDAQRTIDLYQAQDGCAGVLAELDVAAHTEPMRQAGCVYHLGRVFERVNDRYFHAQLSQPRLTWNQSMTYRKYGHYAFASDTLLVSVSLDRPEVPEYVVEFIMYHELLHKKHGLALSARRRVAHTPAFRRDEKAFKHYAEATAFLARYSRKLSSRR